VSKEPRSGIISNPNRLDDPEYLVRLVKQVITVSLQMGELVDELVQVITQEDWVGEMLASGEP